MFAMNQINRFMHSTTGNYFRLFVILFSFFGIFLSSIVSFASAQPTEACPTGAASCLKATGTLLCTDGSHCAPINPTGAACPPTSGGHDAYTTECEVGGVPSGANTVICNIVGVYNAIISAIFIIGLMLMILGGSLYAGAHLLPGATKGTLQGYGMGMVLGGLIGLIIAVLAPFIFGVITGNTAGIALSTANAFCAP